MSDPKNEASATTTSAIAGYAVPLGMFPDPNLLQDIDDLRRKHRRKPRRRKRRR
jgi:hypothetical protein